MVALRWLAIDYADGLGGYLIPLFTLNDREIMELKGKWEKAMAAIGLTPNMVDIHIIEGMDGAA